MNGKNDKKIMSENKKKTCPVPRPKLMHHAGGWVGGWVAEITPIVCVCPHTAAFPAEWPDTIIMCTRAHALYNNNNNNITCTMLIFDVLSARLAWLLYTYCTRDGAAVFVGILSVCVGGGGNVSRSLFKLKH